MASYVAEILGPGEKLLYEGRVSLFAILPSLIGGLVMIAAGAALAFTNAGLLALGLSALGVLWIVAALIRRSATELAVTDRRVIAKFGLVSRSTIELNLTKIESIRVQQSVMGRICNYGSVYVTGTGSTMDPIAFIANPIGFRQAVQGATDAMQRPELRA